ncbi:hypothetical protein CsSME_00028517 [Camellia sinensis var. sinensis]
MSTTLLFTVILHLLLLLSPPLALSRPTNTVSRVVAATRPRGSKSQDYVDFKPETSHGQHDSFQSRDVNGCLPKGLRYSSAPSRNINYHTFGSNLCSSGKHMTKP